MELTRRETQPGPVKRAKRKQRPQYSCSSCSRRKVKCDRVKPCHACCMRGTPSECDYPTGEKDRHYVEQSAVIASLRRSCDSLKQQLNKTQNAATAGLLSSATTASFPFPGLSNDRHSSVTSPMSPSKAFSEIFIQRFIDDFSLQTATNNVGFVAFRRGAEMRAFSPFLCRAFDAASLIFIGRREGNYSIDACGQRKYVKVLKELQDSLNSPEQRTSSETLIVVVLFTVIEAYKGSSKDAMLRHQLGALQLLQTRTPYRHRYGIGRSLFVDLRLYWVSAAVVIRMPTFLASSEWRTVPWPADGPPKDILHQLLDIMVEIPGYLYEVDRMMELLHASSVSSSTLMASQTTLSERACELDRRLLRWKSVCADTYPLGSWWEEKAYSNKDRGNNFPVFQCKDLTTMSVITPSQLVYPDVFLLTSMLYYWAARLVLSQQDPSLVEVIGVQERYIIACNICRSLESYIQTVPGGLLSRLMFILRVVYDTFPEGTIEKQYVSQVFSYITNEYRSTIFARQCSELAVNSK
ncbi:hypothetical protein BDV59DRAFT_190785 [Aspergillus ambiguus]|uniref:Zn(II)2Cys6 transcription factor domain-containing protein n=1 Tax=Aspergillus ambiguus TaxID=176160 RepID=UPI003CCD6239